MIRLKVNDTVHCQRAGDGEYKITDIKNIGSSNEEVHLQDVKTKRSIGWFYSAHVSYDRVKMIKNRYDNKMKTAKAILAKEKRNR